MEWASEFPGLAGSTYLNACAHGLLPRRARAAIADHLDRWERAPSWEAWTEVAERARRAFARLIGARPEEIALQANASSGMAAVMSALRHGRIVTLDIDFPTSRYIAQRQTARGLKHEQLSLGDVDAATWAPHVRGAALACIPYVASFNGYRLDVAEFARRAHEHDVPVSVDAFQACGAFPIDVKRLDIDFLATGVYKWMLGPSGLGFLYARPDHHALVPTTGGWYAAADGIGDPMGPPAADARRFEYGGPSILGCVGATASIELLLKIGLDAIERTNRALTDRVIEHARERKYDVVTPASRAGIVSFRVPDLDRALAACARENVIVNSRIGAIRVSPHFYNTTRDVDRLFEVLDRV